jgi:diketogulonate reductase-like aldo/keto reductase
VKSDHLDNRLLNRREFNGLSMTLGSSLLVVGAIAARSSPVEAGTNDPGRTVKFRDGTVVPALGQGSWHLGEGRHPGASEEEALQALVYAGGRSEELIGRVIAGQRDRVFLVSKVPPNRATEDSIADACETSLVRLGTDHLDLYLLHWRGGITNLSGTVMSFENLRSAGKIHAWGVSNFSVKDMEELFLVSHGDRCATNQVALQCRRSRH